MDRPKLVETLNLVGQALATQNLVPIFQCYCFKNGTVTAFNDELAVVAPCEVKDTFAVFGKTFRELLENGSGDEVDISLDDDVVIKYGKSVMRLPYFSESDFIFEPPKVGVEAIMTGINEIKAGIEVCLPTASTDETQRAIMGVTVTPGAVYSCDGDSITKAVLPKTIDFATCLLPGRFCETFLRLADRPSLAILIDWVVAEANGVWIYHKLQANPNPFDYEGAINSTLKGVPKYTEVTTELDWALRRAVVIGAPTSAKTLLEISKNKLVLTTDTAMGTVRDVVPFKHPDITANVSAALVHRAIGLCKEMAIMENCTVYRSGDKVLHVLGNM